MNATTTTTQYAVVRYADGVTIGSANLTADEFRHYESMSQQPEGVIRLGALPHRWYDLATDHQDESGETTVYLA